MPQSRCLKCDNAGVVIEYRLVWKVRGEDGAPADGSLLVGSEAEGWEEASALGAQAFDVDVVSGARKCVCRMVRPKKKRVALPKSETKREEARDWKMAQAGDS